MVQSKLTSGDQDEFKGGAHAISMQFNFKLAGLKLYNIMFTMNKKAKIYLFWIMVAVVGSFFLPWVKIQPGANLKAESVQDTVNCIAWEGYRGIDIPKACNSGANSFILSVAAVFNKNASYLKIVSWGVYIVPLAAIVAYLYVVLGKRLRNKRRLLFIKGFAFAFLMSYFLLWPMLGRGLAHIKPGIGIYIVIMAYFSMGLIGLKSMVRR